LQIQIVSKNMWSLIKRGGFYRIFGQRLFLLHILKERFSLLVTHWLWWGSYRYVCKDNHWNTI